MIPESRRKRTLTFLPPCLTMPSIYTRPIQCRQFDILSTPPFNSIDDNDCGYNSFLLVIKEWRAMPFISYEIHYYIISSEGLIVMNGNAVGVLGYHT